MCKKRALIILSSLITACLLFALTVHLLYKRYTREVMNSNWSLDGEWIVFECRSGSQAIQSSLYLVRPDGSDVMRLTGRRINTSMPSWSPDGREIVFEKSGMLYKLKRGAKKLTPLTITRQPDRMIEFPVWSPDGQWIAFISSPPPPSQEASTLYRVSADGKAQDIVTIDARRGWITWTADGQWIVYYAYSPSPPWDLRKVRVDGSESQDVLPLNMVNPAWSPDGKWIASIGDSGMDVIREDGGEKPRAIDFPADRGPFDLAWSPDGRWIVFGSNGYFPSQIFKIRPDGSDRQRITDLPHCFASNPDWIKMPERK